MSFDIKKLKEPFNNVSWRIGSKSGNKGRFLAYIDARDVMDRLDDVCGIENWQTEIIKIDCESSIIDYMSVKRKEYKLDWNTKNIKEEDVIKKVINRIDNEKYIIIQCKLSIKINGEWISKVDGTGIRDTESEKSAHSDALKRAAVHFGIGRYLYDVKSRFVDLGSDWKDFNNFDDLPEKSKEILLKSLKDAEMNLINFDNIKQELLDCNTKEDLFENWNFVNKNRNKFSLEQLNELTKIKDNIKIELQKNTNENNVIIEN